MGRTATDYDLRPIVLAALQVSENKAYAGSPIFTLARFAKAVQQEFGLEKQPTPEWCGVVLSRLRYVRPISGGFQWQYLGPNPPDDRSC